MLNEIKRCMASFLIIISSLLYTLCIHATVPYEQLKEWHIRSLSEQTPDHKRKLFAATYDILAKKEKREQASHPTFDQAFYKEMELFVGDGKRADANIMANIDRTESVAGSIMLRKMASILSANTDPDTFTARQSFVRQLVENQQLFDRVATLCTQYAQSEEIFLSNWDNTGIHQKDLNKHYYTWFPSLNNSPTALTLGEYERFIEANVFPAMAVGVTALTLVRLGYYSNFDSSDFWDAISKTSCALPNNCLHYANPQNTYNFLKKAWNKENPFRLDPTSRNTEAEEYVKYFARIIQTPLYLWGLHSSHKLIMSTNEELAMLQKRLVGFADFIHTTAEVRKLVDEYTDINKSLAGEKEVRAIFENREEIVTLAGLLKSEIFKKSHNISYLSYFTDSGTILAAHNSVQENKEQFLQAIEMIGELDSCLSMAKIIKESKQQPVGYCLAEIKNTDSPYINLQSFWLPLLDPAKAIPNDLELGGGADKPQQIILTGSNTGGKSTVGLKSPLVSLYLGHSLGIAPARECNASRFAAFASYLHVNDDTAAGDSAFKAELRRVNDMLTVIKNLQKNEKIFVVIDELFRGTGSDAGEFGAYKVSEYLSKQPHVMSIIATHAKKLTSLEKENGRSINMKIDAKKDEEGNIVRPHKLEPGISDSNIAIELMKRDLDGIGFN